LVVQVARLLEQFVRSQAHFAAIFAAQSLSLQGHLLSIHHDEAMKKPYQIAAGRAVQRARQWAEEKSPVVQLVLPMIEILTLAILAEYNAAPSAGNGDLPFTVTQVNNFATMTLAPPGTPLWHPQKDDCGSVWPGSRSRTWFSGPAPASFTTSDTPNCECGEFLPVRSE